MRTTTVIAALIVAAAPSAFGQTYKIVDTGQATTYNNSASIAAPSPGDAFYGQDAQHAGNAPSYTVSGDGLTVLDNQTGLTWQQGLTTSKMTFTQAQAYVGQANAASFGGFNDWQLPTIKQLYSLIDYRGTDPNPQAGGTTGLQPFIDDSVFAFQYGTSRGSPRVIDSQWVSSTAYTANSNMVFGVNFADGRIKGYELTTPNPVEPNKTFEVRLVRGNTAYGTNGFADNGDGTITDRATDLQWAKNDSGAGMDWQAALAWVQQKNAENYLGHDDWRMANAKEMQSIVDYSRSPDTTGSPAIDPAFNTTEVTNINGDADYPNFWTSTTHARAGGIGENAVYIAFGRALGSYDNGVTVTDVHGAGAQRSDPKQAAAGTSYPYISNAPQADVQNVFNYVRLVRDADPIPEPATMALLALGGLVVTGRRKQQRK